MGQLKRKIEKRSKHEIFKAIEEKDHDKIKEILKSGLNVEEVLDDHDTNPFQFAIINDDIEAVKLFLDHGVDIERRINHFGGYYKNLTPLHAAARRGNTEIAKLLIEKGANIFEKTDERTTLHFAAIGGSEWLVEYLLKKGIDVNSVGHANYLPIHNAASNCNFEIVEILLKAGASINAQNEFGSTPLHLAAGWLDYEKDPIRHRKTIELLIENGADLYHKTEFGRIPAEEAYSVSVQDFIGTFAAKQKGDPIADWLNEAVDFFRGMGFFEKYKDLSKKEFIDKIKELMKKNHFTFSLNYTDPDVPFILLDEERVYNCPMIGDANMDFAVTEKDKRYAEFMTNLNPIGRNIIKFEGVSETWKHEDREIEVSFKYEGKKYTISQALFGEYFDWSFIQQINDIIKDSGYEIGFYRVHEIDAWNGIIVLLNAAEKEKLIKERGWKLLNIEQFQESRKQLEEIYHDRKCEEWEEEAFSYMDEGKLDKALDLFERILKYQKDISRNWRNAARVLLLQGKNQDAKKYLEKSIEIDLNWLKKHPDSDYSWYNIACSHSLLKNKIKMLENLKKAIELNENNKKKAEKEEEFKSFKDDEDFLALL